MTTSDGFWAGKTVFVTGGASFIGSTFTDQLLARSVKKVRIVDDLSSGHLGNIRQHLGTGKVDFLQADLREPGVTRAAMQGVDIVFHLAADHGGRGYVDLHQAGPASNFFLDGLVFAEALKAKVKKVVFASSGCVYPNFLQSDTKKELYLTEDLTKGPNDADNTYGWAKLMGEFTLQAYAKEHGMGAASCRYFTVYGPRGVENHAVIAMIARAFLGQNPFEVWGDGTQIRNWTYIDDIVEGTILAGEKINDGTAINLGTMERIRVIDCAKMVCGANSPGTRQTSSFARTCPLARSTGWPIILSPRNSSAGNRRCSSAKASSAPSIGTTPPATKRKSNASSRVC